MSEKPHYVIYAPEWDENNGGAIFLHRLIHELNNLGEEASIFPMRPLYDSSFRKRISRWFKRSAFAISPNFDTPIWTKQKLPENAIVVYPEIVPGNPLKAQYVARWLLYPPGELGGPKTFDKTEIFFKASDFSDDVTITGTAQLLVLWWVYPAYRDTGIADRSGSCYMMRKGKNREIVHEINDSCCLDGLSHTEIAEAFNKTKTFYCYDDATMYSLYAALCGCTSVVIPWHYETREQWILDRPIVSYGVAHGLDDIPHAEKTRHLVKAHLQKKTNEGQESVANFVRTTRAHFGFIPSRTCEELVAHIE